MPFVAGALFGVIADNLCHLRSSPIYRIKCDVHLNGANRITVSMKGSVGPRPFIEYIAKDSFRIAGKLPVQAGREKYDFVDPKIVSIALRVYRGSQHSNVLKFKQLTANPRRPQLDKGASK
jgi:hypothetical protein